MQLTAMNIILSPVFFENFITVYHNIKLMSIVYNYNILPPFIFRFGDLLYYMRKTFTLIYIFCFIKSCRVWAVTLFSIGMTNMQRREDGKIVKMQFAFPEFPRFLTSAFSM